jgi:protein involved in polysaccharide export with SLBB domain
VATPAIDYYLADVSPEGTIFIPLVGELVVRGLTLEQARTQILDELSRYYKDVKVVVTLEKLRWLQVFVVGDVVRAGAYRVSGLDTVFNALYYSGGPSERGSMRAVQLIRNNQAVGTLDFYAYLLTGDKSQDLPLENGDTVFVPVVGRFAAIWGEIKRPSLYELKGGERLSDLIRMAGGVTATGYLARAQIERSKDNERTVLDVDVSAALKGAEGQDVELEDGDWVRILKVTDVRANDVYIEGDVLRPGEYELKPGMKVRDLIATAQGLGPREPFLERAVVFRTLPDASIQIVSFNLRKALDGVETDNVELQRWDRVLVHSYSELRQIDSRSLARVSQLRKWQDARTVSVLGEVARPGIYEIKGDDSDRLAVLMREAGGLTPDAFPEGAVFLRDVRQLTTSEHMKLASEVKQRFESLANRYYQAELLARLGLSGAPQATPAVGGTMGTVGAAAGALVGLAGEQGTREGAVAAPAELPPIVPTGRVPLDLKRIVESNGKEEDVVLRDGDTIIIPPKALAVIVTGAVAIPSSIIYRPSQAIDYYVRRAGGYTEDSDAGRSVIIRASGELTPASRSTAVQPGDIIMVPAKAYLERPKSRREKLSDNVRLATEAAATLYLLHLLIK